MFYLWDKQADGFSSTSKRKAGQEVSLPQLDLLKSNAQVTGVIAYEVGWCLAEAFRHTLCTGAVELRSILL
jgi:hypothetical protein